MRKQECLFCGFMAGDRVKMAVVHCNAGTGAARGVKDGYVRGVVHAQPLPRCHMVRWKECVGVTVLPNVHVEEDRGSS